MPKTLNRTLLLSFVKAMLSEHGLPSTDLMDKVLSGDADTIRSVLISRIQQLESTQQSQQADTLRAMYDSVESILSKE